MSDAPETVSSEESQPQSERELVESLQDKPFFTRFAGYVKLSGPGWLQSAITLGGGSLSGSLYLGVLAGFGLMWLQPLAMILGIVMLSAIAYVTLSTGKRPFEAINTHVNPVLGWGWAIASLMANLVWCMPQFALGTAAIQQNLMPGILGAESSIDPFTSKMLIVGVLLAVAGTVVFFYETGGWGVKLFEGILKVLVGIIVLCFFGVIVSMTFSPEGLAWGEILAGFIPDFTMAYTPSPKFAEALAATGEFSSFWSNMIVSDQQKVMITAAATAVGINMTFLLPYSMLKKGWGKQYRELAICDLAMGLFIPFMLATSCVVIASASQFHAKVQHDADGNRAPLAKNLVGGFNGLLDKRLGQEIGKDKLKELQAKGNEDKLAAARDALPEGDKDMAYMLVKRDAFNLANSLKPLTGSLFAQYIFGVGVLGMAVSTIIILMLINGFVLCEMTGLHDNSTFHRIGCYMAGLTGALGPFIWGSDEAKLWLAVPTSMFGMVLLPVAYFSFFFLMNSRSLLGEHMPKGGQKILWNGLMGLAAALAAFGSFWSLKTSSHPTIGFTVFGSFIALAVVVHFISPPKPVGGESSEE